MRSGEFSYESFEMSLVVGREMPTAEVVCQGIGGPFNMVCD